MVDRLVGEGDEVLVLDDLSRGSTANLEAALAAGARLEQVDIRDAGTVEKVVTGFTPRSCSISQRRSTCGPP